jgi:hypothetical protein
MKAYYRIGFFFACAGAALAQALPQACAVLTAHAASSGADTARIQAALNLCGPGQAVVLKRDGNHSRFQTAPLILPRAVILLIDRDVTLMASRNRRDYDLEPGSCGAAPTGKAARCKPLIFAYQAAFSGIMGPGSIDGQADAWKGSPAEAVLPDLVSSYESQNFQIQGITLRNAPGGMPLFTKPPHRMLPISRSIPLPGRACCSATRPVARCRMPGSAFRAKRSISSRASWGQPLGSTFRGSIFSAEGALRSAMKRTRA